MHGDKLPIEHAACGMCLEENKLCKCEHDDKSLKPVEEHVNTEHAVESLETNSSFSHSVINMTGMLIGLGQLSTPYGLVNGGWVSIFLLLALGVIGAYSACLLGKCLERNPKSKSYIDIGEEAFGTKGKIIAAIFVYMEIFMGLVSYTISLHDNLDRVFTGVPVNIPQIKLPKTQLLTVIAVLVTLPSLWLRKLSCISFLSTGGILMSLLLFGTVASTAILGVVKASHSIPVLRINKISHVSGLYAFSYAGHVVFPDIYKAMKDPSKYMKVAITSFTVVMSLYTTLAFMGAELFGPSVKSQITLSMPQDLIATKIALWATVLTPMSKYALQFAPFAIQLERNLPPLMKSRTKIIIRGSIGSILLLIILTLALCVPYFQYVLSLTGSLVSITICIIFPCTFYTKIRWAEISKPLCYLNVIIIAIGTILNISGTTTSLKSLITIIKTASHPR